MTTAKTFPSLLVFPGGWIHFCFFCFSVISPPDTLVNGLETQVVLSLINYHFYEETVESTTYFCHICSFKFGSRTNQFEKYNFIFVHSFLIFKTLYCTSSGLTANLGHSLVSDPNRRIELWTMTTHSYLNQLS